MPLNRRIPQAPSGEMPFLDHLEELRWRIIYALSALIVGVVIGFVVVFRFGLFALLTAPIKPYLAQGGLVQTGPVTAVTVFMQLAFIVGIVIALPVIVYQVWAFLSPALHVHERRVVQAVLAAGTVLFGLGAALAFFIIVPQTLRLNQMLQELSGNAIIPMYEVGAYLGFLTTLALVCGLAFEVPVVLVVLVALGILSAGTLARGRKLAVIVVLVGSALITPGDAISPMVMLAGPLYTLYELSIAISWIIERRKLRRREAESIAVPG